MANATPRDMRAGFEIYRLSGFQASLDEINDTLVTTGYGPVSERALRHFRALTAAGFDRYISINRFDIARAAMPYEGSSANARYDYRDSDVGARMTFAHKSSIYEELGVASRIGEAGAVIRFEDPAGQQIVDAKVSTTDSVRVTFFAPEMSTPARVLDVVRNEDNTLVEVEFARLKSIGDYVGESTMPTSTVHLRLLNADGETSSDEPQADLVGRRLFFTIELLEAARAVVNEYLESNDRDEYAAPVTVRRLRVESPQDLVASAPQIVGAISTIALSLLAPYWTYHRIRLTAGKADEQKHLARSAKAKADVDEAKAEVETKIYQAMAEELGAGEVTERAKALVEKQLLAQVESLAEHDIVEVQSESVTASSG